MNLHIRSGKKTYAVSEPCSIEVTDPQGALIAVVMQQDPNSVQILTPGDIRFETYALMHRVPQSKQTIIHPDEPGAGMLLDGHL